MTSTGTFIKAAELWLPVADPPLLEFGGGAFGTARAFEHRTRSMCFGRAEGLPGRAWDEARPVLLPRLDVPEFRRAAIAQAAGFSCAVALPYFNEHGLHAVMVLFGGHASALPAAMELWREDAGGATMSLVEGAYGSSAADFEALSRRTSFPPGTGLPGTAWHEGAAVFAEDLEHSGAFVRTEAAARAGLIRGLAIPFTAQTGQSHVVALLAGAGLPLASRVERWIADPSGETLQRAWAFSELHGGRSAREASLPMPRHYAGPAGAIGRAWLTGVPAISDAPGSEPGAIAAAAAGIGANCLIALPVSQGHTVREVLALYL